MQENARLCANKIRCEYVFQIVYFPHIVIHESYVIGQETLSNASTVNGEWHGSGLHQYINLLNFNLQAPLRPLTRQAFDKLTIR